MASPSLRGDAINGIVAYGGYVPSYRLRRELMSGSGPGAGQRSVAGGDEDTTTMGVEAARVALASTAPRALYFSTSTPSYLDKTNAATIHAALDLDETVPAADLGGSVRSGAAALRLALAHPEPALVVLADLRTGVPGNPDHRGGADGAAAFVVGGAGPFVADYLGGASRSAEYLDRWRLPDEPTARHWEPQFPAEISISLGEAALKDALAVAGVDPGELDWLVVACANTRAARRVATGVGVTRVDQSELGDAGTAQPGLLLASTLDQAAAGQTIAVLTLADGAEAFVFRATGTLTRQWRPPATGPTIEIDYPTFLAWRGLLTEQTRLRPPPDAPSAVASHRSNRWRLGLYAGACRACGTRHLPPQRVCLHCRAGGEPDLIRLADDTGTIANLTVDRIAWVPHPPARYAVVDLDGGGRLHCELTDAGEVAVGDRVELTFRRRFTTDGRHTYFWKARPIRSQ